MTLYENVQAITKLKGIEDDKTLEFTTKEEQNALLAEVLAANDDAAEIEDTEPGFAGKKVRISLSFSLSLARNLFIGFKKEDLLYLLRCKA